MKWYEDIFLDGIGYREFIFRARNLVGKYQKIINNLNFFPVSDKDTGSNLYSTLSGICKELEEVTSNNIERVSEVVYKSAFEYAVGSSGNILATFFKGFHKGCIGKESLDIFGIIDSLYFGARFAYLSLENPREGTILTAMKTFADRLKNYIQTEDSFTKAMVKSINDTIKVLIKTGRKEFNIKKVNIIDSGGLGYIVIISGLDEDTSKKLEKILRIFENVSVKLKKEEGFCINVIIEVKVNKENITKEIKEMLKKHGEDIIINKEGKSVKVHVHSKDPSKILECLSKVGNIKKVDLSEI